MDTADQAVENKDIIVRPSHYTSFEIEPITFIMRNRLDFATGNVIKYVCRAGRKQYEGMDLHQSRITDLRKARRYIDMLVNLAEDGEEL